MTQGRRKKGSYSSIWLLLSRKVRRRLTIAVVLIILLLAAADRLGYWKVYPQGDQARYHQKTFRVVQVLDGDTFDLDIPDGKHPYTRIRLWGVDTPETEHSQRGQMYFGAEASAFTREKAMGQKVTVTLEPNRKARDKYQRLLAYIYLPDGKMLNEELIRWGYGYADTRFEHVLMSRFRELEKDARREKRGLWAGVQPEQMPGWYNQRNEAK